MVGSSLLAIGFFVGRGICPAEFLVFSDKSAYLLFAFKPRP